MFYTYGERGNKVLLMNYGFCYENNIHEYFSLGLKFDWDMKSENAPDIFNIVEFFPNAVLNEGKERCQKVRL